MKFLCDQCKAKYQIADEKAAGKTVRMKCRKCGHLIEVRAAVTESSVATKPPPAGAPAGTAPAPPAGAAKPGAPYRSAQQPAPPRAAPLATSLAAAKPAARERSGALAGAFKSNVRDEETSAPIDMSDLSPNDEWYVAINGVPVGPIRIAEIRRKAALGGVTEESLAWQEGLDEWRPVRSFPELAATVREAIASGRASIAPPAPPRTSAPPPRPPPRPPSPASPAGPQRTSPPTRSPLAPAAAAPPGATARSNVVPINSRLATAERLEAPKPEMASQPAIVPDPFASRPSTSSAPAPFADSSSDRLAPAPAAAPVSLASPIPLATDLRVRRSPPWIAIGMIAAFVAFGVTAGLVIFLRPAPQPTPVVVQMPAPPAATASAPATVSATADAPQPTVAAAAPTKAAGPGGGGSRSAGNQAQAAAPTSRALDLRSLTQNQTSVAPTDDGAGEAPRAPGQCFSSGQVQQFVSTHQAAIQRTCWERNPSNRLASNVSVALTVDPDGSVQGVSATGDETSIAKCIEGEVRGWHFPAMGCTQRMSIPFHFVRQ